MSKTKKESAKTEKTSTKATSANNDFLANCENLINVVVKNTEKLKNSVGKYSNEGLSNSIPLTESFEKLRQQVMENAKRTEDTWILNAQPDQWRNEDAKKAFESIQETLNKLDAEASEKMDKLTPPTPGGTGTNDDQVTGIINSIGTDYATSEAKKDLMNLFNDRAKTFFQRLQDEGLTSHKSVSRNIYAFGAGIGGANSKEARNIRSDINRQIMEEIDNYIDDMDNFRILIQDTRLMEEFISDPKAFLDKDIGSIKDVLTNL